MFFACSCLQSSVTYPFYPHILTLSICVQNIPYFNLVAHCHTLHLEFQGFSLIPSFDWLQSKNFYCKNMVNNNNNSNKIAFTYKIKIISI